MLLDINDLILRNKDFYQHNKEASLE